MTLSKEFSRLTDITALWCIFLPKVWEHKTPRISYPNYIKLSQIIDMGRAFQRAQELYIELWHRVWWTVGTGQPLSPRLEQQHIPGFVTSQLEWDRAKVSSCLFEFVILQIVSTEKARRMQKVKLHQTMMKHDEVFGSWDLLCYDSNGADSAFSLHLYLGCQANLPVRDDVKGFNRSLDKHKSKILVEVFAMLKALAVAKSKTSTSIGYIMLATCTEGWSSFPWDHLII